MKKGSVHVGTSGWHYKHWRGTFYPADIKDAEQFAFYKKCFNTVELNNSFYRLPTHKAFSDWKINSPRGFIFSVKASRFITHMKKLKMDRISLRKFFSRVDRLGNKLGPILFQLPPRWNVNLERLESFLSVLPKGYRYSFEFRNQSWYQQRIYDVLHKYQAAFCLYELERHLSPTEITADFVYIRLHGPGNKYQGSYTDAQLRQWALKCKRWQREGKDVYVYFDNDQAGYAAFNAIRLKEFLK